MTAVHIQSQDHLLTGKTETLREEDHNPKGNRKHQSFMDFKCTSFFHPAY